MWQFLFAKTGAMRELVPVKSRSLLDTKNGQKEVTGQHMVSIRKGS